LFINRLQSSLDVSGSADRSMPVRICGKFPIRVDPQSILPVSAVRHLAATPKFVAWSARRRCERLVPGSYVGRAPLPGLRGSPVLS